MELKRSIRCWPKRTVCRVLIVPYGIETIDDIDYIVVCVKVLIVPYGIETLESASAIFFAVSFNRTLWN